MRKILFPAIGLVFSITACGIKDSPRTFTDSEKPFIHHLSPEAVITYPPFIRQESPDLCGLAAAKMIAAYYGQNLNPEDLSAVESTAKKMGGASGQEMKNLLQNSGFEVSVFPGSLKAGGHNIFSEIDRARPLIVMLKKGTESHYMVLDGYDPKKNLVILNDPRDGPIALPIKNFKMGWESAGKFTLLALPMESAERP
jgi:ABC-type bacteriocin/lantibiotic exporter with double-glycine peptidase domain